MPSAASRPAPAELLAALGDAMRARGFRWYVFGAQAVAVYGRPRLTADVDVTIEPAGAGAGEVIAMLGPHGFAPRFALSAEHLGGARLLPMVHLPRASRSTSCSRRPASTRSSSRAPARSTSAASRRPW